MFVVIIQVLWVLMLVITKELMSNVDIGNVGAGALGS